jgi:hypothetical protein
MKDGAIDRIVSQDQSQEIILEIETSDTRFERELIAQRFDGIRVCKEMMSFDDINSVQLVSNAIKVIISPIAIGLFTSWLYDRIKNKRPEKTTINNYYIVTNPEQIPNVLKEIVNAEKKDK